MFVLFIFFCLCSWCLAGVFGDEVSVTEGDSVSLHTDYTDTQRKGSIMWKFGPKDIPIAQIDREDNVATIFNDSADGRFRDRLKLDQTGSLIITNTRITDSGLYKVFGRTETPLNNFSLTVYAPLPIPVITRYSTQNSSSSSSSSSSCSFMCSVVNVSDVTLSWYKGNSLLPSMTVSDLNRSLSLHLECLDDFYSCVVNNPIRNQTTHLNTELCQTCSDPPDPVSPIVLISVAAGFLLILASVWIFCICRKCRKTDQEVQTHTGEIIYSDPTFYKRRGGGKPQNCHGTKRVQEENDVVYAGVAVK